VSGKEKKKPSGGKKPAKIEGKVPKFNAFEEGNLELHKMEK